MRRKEREITDTKKILTLIEESHVLHLGLFDDTYPYVVPVNYGYEQTDNGQFIFYIHGARQGKKIRLIQKNPAVCIQIDGRHELIETGKTAEKYSFAYHSLIGYGTATLLDQTEEKIHALELLMIHETTKNLSHFNPMPEMIVQGTGIIKISIDSFTGKEHLNEPSF